MSESAEPRHAEPADRPEGSSTGLLRVVVAEASLVAALMFYLGATYTSQFYRYFNLYFFSLEFSFANLVVQSLHLLRLPVLLAILLITGLAAAPWARGHLPQSSRRTRPLPPLPAARFLAPLLIAAGVLLVILWRWIHPYAWTAPLAIAAGFLLGAPWGAGRRSPSDVRRRTMSVFVAGVCVFWALTQVTRQIAQDDAREHARNVQGWTRVMILSSKRLSLPTPGTVEERLPVKDLLLPYRYTGLRLLAEGNGRYYVVPDDWKVENADPIYAIRGSDDLWISLRAA
ncbi:hypothetical protein ACIPY6_40530 [Streptomyces sp. NPDC090054]|uniref:hypothetical protein n=1 Tax=Streptomyces sp. NPDC090054 TaxID=3365933 RepID=UPI0038131C05